MFLLPVRKKKIPANFYINWCKSEATPLKCPGLTIPFTLELSKSKEKKLIMQAHIARSLSSSRVTQLVLNWW